MEALTERVPLPYFVLLYGQKDVTSDIAKNALSVTYTDKLRGESDEVEIELEDTDGRWRSVWYPQKGDVITLKMGYVGTKLLPCGDFQIDELQLEGPPDVVSIRGLASGITQELRTKRSKAFENQTLRQIASQVARANGLQVTGTIADLKMERVTQNQESDLAFLKRLAEAYGYAFSVRGQQLVFHDLADLDAGASVLKLSRSDIKRLSLKDKSHAVYRACQVSYFDPKTQRLIQHTETNPGVASGDVLKLDERCESRAHAEARAKAALRQSRGGNVEGTLTVVGDQRLVSGNNIQLDGLGRYDGLYQIRLAKHSTQRGAGYSVEVEVSRVGGAGTR